MAQVEYGFLAGVFIVDHSLPAELPLPSGGFRHRPARENQFVPLGRVRHVSVLDSLPGDELGPAARALLPADDRPPLRPGVDDPRAVRSASGTVYTPAFMLSI